jgi:hypothetical protein
MMMACPKTRTLTPKTYVISLMILKVVPRFYESLLIAAMDCTDRRVFNYS